MSQRIHIIGASGSGTSTLGTELAHRLKSHHLDTDDYFWFHLNIIAIKEEKEKKDKTFL